MITTILIIIASIVGGAFVAGMGVMWYVLRDNDLDADHEPL